MREVKARTKNYKPKLWVAGWIAQAAGPRMMMRMVGMKAVD
jgi:hypothetical protein